MAVRGASVSWVGSARRKVEIVHEPALGHEKADELLGRRRCPLKNHAGGDLAIDREWFATRPKWPLDCSDVLIVVVGPFALERVGIERLTFAVMTTACARNALLLPLSNQVTASGGVQPLRYITV